MVALCRTSLENGIAQNKVDVNLNRHRGWCNKYPWQLYKWPVRCFVLHPFYTGKSTRGDPLTGAQRVVQLILHFCAAVCYIGKALFLLIQALPVLRGLAGKATLINLSWHGFGPNFVPVQTFMCTLLRQNNKDFSHLS